jgi:acetyltransferase-like isoleucine patch superfamily enzyme
MLYLYKYLMKVYYKILKLYWSITVPLYLKLSGVKLHKNIIFYGFPLIQMGKNSKIIINDNVVLCSDSRFTQLGINHPVILKTSPNAEISIGSDTGISGASIYAHQKVSIGKECLIGADVKIFDTNFHSLNKENRRFNKDENEISSKEILIEDNCFVGANAIILKGSIIKKDTVIPAGSIIREKIIND